MSVIDRIREAGSLPDVVAGPGRRFARRDQLARRDALARRDPLARRHIASVAPLDAQAPAIARHAR